MRWIRSLESAQNAADRPASTSVFGDELASVLLNDPASPAAEETVHFSVVRPGKTHGGYFALWISLVVFTFAALLFSKNTFFRFQSWTFFLSQPQILIPAVVWLVGALGLQLIGFLRGSRSSLYDRIFRSYWFLPIAVFSWVGSAALFFASMCGAPVLAGQVVGGKPQAQSCCSLKYSDPRGYRYTFQRDSYYRIRIAPGGHNRLQDYDIQVTLPSWNSRMCMSTGRFHYPDLTAQLQPSSTNDILKLHLAGDSFSGSREILFTTKYRTLPNPCVSRSIWRHRANRRHMRFKAAFGVFAVLLRGIRSTFGKPAVVSNTGFRRRGIFHI